MLFGCIYLGLRSCVGSGSDLTSGRMSNVIASTLRLIRSFNRHDSAERVRSMRQIAADDPEGILAPWLAAIAFWEEGEIEEARRLAEVILEKEPTDFRMLVICLDWSIRIGDPRRTLAYAERVASVERPTRRMRKINAVLSVLFWPIRLLGYGGGMRHEVKVLDAWSEYAREYVKVHGQNVAAT